MFRIIGAAGAATLALALLGAAGPAQALPPGCNPLQPVTCEYHSPASFTTQHQDFIFTDPARADHPVPFRVRYPVGAREPRPVIFWHHGGFASEWKTHAPDWVSKGQDASEERSRSFARAGYVVIHIGRMPANLRGNALADCRAAGWITSPGPIAPPDELLRCSALVGHHVYGRSNVPFVVDLLRRGRVVLPPAFNGSFDLDRIVIGGWSGGTEIVLNFAGAPKQFGRLRLDPLPVNGRVVAFFADAPRRPDFACPERLSSPSGFDETAFRSIDERPFLFNTGKGDVGPDACPTQARDTAWLASAHGHKYLAWTHVTDIDHSGVDINAGHCALPSQAGLCAALESLGVAYLDAVVMRRPAAQVWLGSAALGVISDGKIEMHRRTPLALGPNLPPGCTAAQPESCLYTPAVDVPASDIRTFDDALYDPARGNHPVPFRVRYPVGVNPLVHGRMPVIIWSHGGGTTRVNGWTSTGHPITVGQLGSEDRSESFARAGYVVFHIGRLPVQNLTQAERDDCARALVTADADCEVFLGWHRYGPQNIAFLAEALRAGRWQAPADLRQRYDPERVVVGGWSGGTESGLNIAGAFQQIRGLRLPPVVVPTAVAFFLESPRGPEWGRYGSGFVDDYQLDLHSFFRIDARPMLFFSGTSDIGADPDGLTLTRPASWLGAQPGRKYLSWARQAAPHGPVHGTMDLSECTSRTHQAYCHWFRNLGLAYLDAVVKERPQAIAWMASDAYSVLTRDWVELHRR